MSEEITDSRALAIARHLREREGTSPAFGITLIDAGVGRAVVRMTVREDMLNGLRTAHGGLIFTLADTAFAYACNSRNVVTFAAHATITFLRPVMCGETLVAEACEDAHVGRTGVYTVVVTNDHGQRVAIFQGLSRTAGGAILPDLEEEH